MGWDVGCYGCIHHGLYYMDNSYRCWRSGCIYCLKPSVFTNIPVVHLLLKWYKCSAARINVINDAQRNIQRVGFTMRISVQSQVSGTLSGSSYRYICHGFSSPGFIDQPWGFKELNLFRSGKFEGHVSTSHICITPGYVQLQMWHS